jgi:capsular polysaccharide biosynthesis protein
MIIIIILTVVAVLVTGFVSFYLLTPKYEARTTVIVKDQSTDNSMAYEDLIASEKLLKTYSEMVKSQSVAETVIERLDLAVTPELLLTQLEVQGGNESLITSITAVHEEPEKAVSVANAFASASLEKWISVMNIDNIYILDEAKLPSEPEPIYPRPLLYMAVAFFLSIIFGVVIAILIEFLDRSLKTEEQIEKLLSLPVLGVIPSADLREQKERKRGRMGGERKISERSRGKYKPN